MDRNRRAFLPAAALPLLVALLAALPTAPTWAADNLPTSKQAFQVDVQLSPTFTRTYEWNIAKSVQPGAAQMFLGDQAEARYTISLGRTFQDSDWRVSGRISIFNPTRFTVKIKAIRDVLGGAPVGLSCNRPLPVKLAPDASLTCSFTAALEDASSRTNLLTVDTAGVINDFSVETPLSFERAEIQEVNGTVQVNDTLGGSWTFSEPGSISFVETYDCSAARLDDRTADTLTFENTATIQETGQSASTSFDVQCFRLELSGVKDYQKTYYTQIYWWSIDKRVNKTEVTLPVGERTLLHYTVVPTWDFERRDFGLRGTLYITNPAPLSAVITRADLALSVGITADLSCDIAFPYLLDPNQTLGCPYDVSVPEMIDGTAEWRVNVQNYLYQAGGDRTEAGTLNFTTSDNYHFNTDIFFPEESFVTYYNSFIEIKDSLVDETFITHVRYPQNWDYSYMLGPYSACGEYTLENTAVFTPSDYDNVWDNTGSDSQTVLVHVPCE